MTIIERIEELEAKNGFLALRKTVDMLKTDSAIVTLDYWLKKTKKNKKHAEIKTERYIVENYNSVDEEVWLDNIPITGGMSRSKSW